jgi:hypothetical protein
VSDKKPDDKGNRKRRPPGERPGPRTDDLAFDNIIEAILDAKPEVVREHRSDRQGKRADRKAKPNATRDKQAPRRK